MRVVAAHLLPERCNLECLCCRRWGLARCSLPPLLQTPQQRLLLAPWFLCGLQVLDLRPDSVYTGAMRCERCQCTKPSQCDRNTFTRMTATEWVPFLSLFSPCGTLQRGTIARSQSYRHQQKARLFVPHRQTPVWPPPLPLQPTATNTIYSITITTTITTTSPPHHHHHQHHILHHHHHRRMFYRQLELSDKINAPASRETHSCDATHPCKHDWSTSHRDDESM